MNAAGKVIAKHRAWRRQSSTVWVGGSQWLEETPDTSPDSLQLLLSPATGAEPQLLLPCRETPVKVVVVVMVVVSVFEAELKLWPGRP